MSEFNQPKDHPLSIMQQLYDNEINVQIESFWDGGFDVSIGDAMNGIDASTSVRSWAEAEAWLAKKASEIYPGSVFAKRQTEPVAT